MTFISLMEGKLPTQRELKPFIQDCECHDMAWAISRKWPACQMRSGFYVKDPKRPYDHAWTILPDGTVLDTTSMQFGSKQIFIKPSDPEHQRYVSYEDHFELAKKYEAVWEANSVRNNVRDK
jgi:hypothetical protein